MIRERYHILYNSNILITIRIIIIIIIFLIRPPISQDYPLNLSILLSGGKETNKDSLSNGE